MKYRTEVIDHKGLWSAGSDHMSMQSAIKALEGKQGRVYDENDRLVWLSPDTVEPEVVRRRDPAAMLQIFTCLVRSQYSQGLSTSGVISKAIEVYDELEKRA